MTEAEYKAGHIALWQFLYDNPGKDKEEWPGWQDEKWSEIRLYHFIEIYCFACRWAYSIDAVSACESCPLDQSVMHRCTGLFSACYRWVNAKTAKTKKKYAAIIRDAWK
jgi:hypothetical protein